MNKDIPESCPYNGDSQNKILDHLSEIKTEQAVILTLLEGHLAFHGNMGNWFRWSVGTLVVIGGTVFAVVSV